MIDKLKDWYEHTGPRKPWVMDSVSDISNIVKELSSDALNEQWIDLFKESSSITPDMVDLQVRISLRATLRKAILGMYIAEGGTYMLDGIDSYRYKRQISERTAEALEDAEY